MPTLCTREKEMIQLSTERTTEKKERDEMPTAMSVASVASAHARMSAYQSPAHTDDNTTARDYPVDKYHTEDAGNVSYVSSSVTIAQIVTMLATIAVICGLSLFVADDNVNFIAGTFVVVCGVFVMAVAGMRNDFRD